MLRLLTIETDGQQSTTTSIVWTDDHKLLQKSNVTASAATQDAHHVQRLIVVS